MSFEKIEFYLKLTMLNFQVNPKILIEHQVYYVEFKKKDLSKICKLVELSLKFKVDLDLFSKIFKIVISVFKIIS